jgi:hypothetical protein
MANQQQSQNPPRPGTESEREQQPAPGKSPGQTFPGQGNENLGDRGQKQNPGDQAQTQNPRDPGGQHPREDGDPIPRDPSKIPE